MPTKVLDTQLFVHQNFQNLPARNRALREDPLSSGLAVEKLILYDELALPTLDFAIVPMLFHWFGRRGVDQLLDENGLSFERPGFEPQPGKENRAWWLAYAAMEPVCSSFSSGLAKVNHFLGKSRRHSPLPNGRWNFSSLIRQVQVLRGENKNAMWIAS